MLLSIIEPIPGPLQNIIVVVVVVVVVIIILGRLSVCIGTAPWRCIGLRRQAKLLY